MDWNKIGGEKDVRGEDPPIYIIMDLMREFNISFVSSWVSVCARNRHFICKIFGIRSAFQNNTTIELEHILLTVIDSKRLQSKLPSE